MNIAYSPEQAFGVGQQSAIGEEVLRWHEAAAEQLPLAPDMNYMVSATLGRPEGWTLAADKVALRLNPAHEAFDSLFGNGYILGRLVAHEAHHTVRGYFKGQPDEPILLTTITEGLADIFADELCQGGVRPLRGNRLAAARAGLQVAQTFGATEWNYEAWFLREPYTGYDMGRLLVERALKRLPEESAASLVRVSSQELLFL